MNSNILVEAVNMIDDELLSDAYSKRDKKMKFNKYLALAAAFAVVTVSVFAGVKYHNSIILDNIYIDSEGSTSVSSEIDFSGAEDSTSVSPEIDFGGAAGDGEVGSGEISNGELVTEGTGFTKEEIRAFVEEKKYELVGAVACEYGNFDDIYRISTVGYCHVSLGETNVLKRDYVVLPISLGDKIIAKITLFKSDGEMRYDIAVRGKSFDTLNKIFAENPESEIAFFYVDLFIELAITPSNKIYNIYDKQTDSIKDGVDYYGKYKTEYNTFSLEKLNDEDNYISVKPIYEENLANADNYTEEIKEEETFQNNLAAMTNKAETDISIADLFSKEIVSVERGNGYMLIENRPFEKCTKEQAETIKGYIYEMEIVVPEETEMYFGGGYVAKLNYSDGSFAYIALKGGNQVYLQTEEGGSPIYVDTSGNAEKLAEYMISLI